MGTRFAVIIAVGPNESNIALDTLDSVKRFYPNADLWIMDDCTNDGTYEQLQAWVAKSTGCKLFRNPKAHGFFYLTRSLATLFHEVLQSGIEYSFILKIDTDTLFVGDGFDDVIMQRFAEEGPGIVGNYRLGAHGNKRSYAILRKKLFLDLMPLRYTPKYKKLVLGWANFSTALITAIKNGYELGSNVFGACYASHIDTVRALETTGYIEKMMSLGPNYTFEEDALFSIGAKAAGHKLIELEASDSRSKAAFLEYGRGCVTLSPQAIREREIKVLHPLKNNPESLAIRRHFSSNAQYLDP